LFDDDKGKQECILSLVVYHLKHDNVSQWIKIFELRTKRSWQMTTAHQGVKDKCIAAVALFPTLDF
jgi:hypothetical protein